jgi:dolichol-phosphate mannosyltransferase
MPNPPPETKPVRALTLLSVVIHARNEEGCMLPPSSTSTIELSLHGVPHEIVVVDEGSTDSTWQILQGEAAKITTLRPVQNPGPHGFGRAITQIPPLHLHFFRFQVSNSTLPFPSTSSFLLP